MQKFVECSLSSTFAQGGCLSSDGNSVGSGQQSAPAAFDRVRTKLRSANRSGIWCRSGPQIGERVRKQRVQRKGAAQWTTTLQFAPQNTPWVPASFIAPIRYRVDERLVSVHSRSPQRQVIADAPASGKRAHARRVPRSELGGGLETTIRRDISSPSSTMTSSSIRGHSEPFL